MTDQEFLALPPREQDALVAVEVMGWGFWKSKYGHWVIIDPDGITHEDGYGAPKFCPSTGRAIDREWWEEYAPPPFTTDISATWKVVEKMREEPQPWSWGMEEVVGGWDVDVGRVAEDATWESYRHKHEDVRLAICLAALKAKGVVK